MKLWTCIDSEIIMLKQNDENYQQDINQTLKIIVVIYWNQFRG